jgi:PqqD family protein of HPr-rel-A system
MPIPRCRLDTGAELHWRRIDDEWLVFDRGSGDTHRFDVISAAVIMCLEAGAQEFGDLCGIISREMALPNNQDLSDRLEALLEQLLRLGLIERLAT